MKQQDIADNFGVTKTCISDIEKGRRTPSYKLLVNLENFFELSHRELFKVIEDDEKYVEKELQDIRSTLEPKEIKIEIKDLPKQSKVY